jgi:homoserine dehydrogenase
MAFNSLQDLPILGIEEVETAYYLRLSALDQPGVLSKITQILSDAGISIEALIQKEPAEGEDRVPVILLTNRTIEKQLLAAKEAIAALDSVGGEVTHIRVESLG